MLRGGALLSSARGGRNPRSHCHTLPIAHARADLYDPRMEREVILVRDGVAVWRGFVKAPSSSTPASARDYLDLAWRKALEEGVVTAEDSGRVQFRFP